MKGRETIFALSSGQVPSGIAVVRASGPGVRFGLETLAGTVPPARSAALRTLRDPLSMAPIDRGIVLFFPAPASFTGEDVAEFQLHGGRAVVAAILGALGRLAGFRSAEAGEFTRRAFENGRADLTEVEGIADLIAAETEMQRRLALSQADGALRRVYEDWRARLIRARALLEASLDFSDEEDVTADVATAAEAVAAEIEREMAAHLDDQRWGERVRSGFEVVLAGAPNVGKSSLLNALAGREAAIVTPEAGTTRDLIEVALDIDGYAVNLVDTAGLREASNIVEREGIRRARDRSMAADLVVLLDDGEMGLPAIPREVDVLRVRSKADRMGAAARRASEGLPISTHSGEGLGELKAAIASALGLARPLPSATITRDRQRRGIEAARLALAGVGAAPGPELKAEALRQAADALGRVVGRIDVEDLLDVIFRDFCIGK